MSSTISEDAIPRVALLGGMAVVVFAVVATLFARWTDVGIVRLTPVVAQESRDLVFDIRGDGSILVREADKGQALRTVPATGNEGFVRVALQTFVRDRTALGIQLDAPYRLMRQRTGGLDGDRLWLEDLTTQRRLTLDAFGSGNAKVFAKFLDERKAVR